MNRRNEGISIQYSEVDLYLQNQKLTKMLKRTLEELYKTRKERDGLKKSVGDLKASVEAILKSANDADRIMKNAENNDLVEAFHGLGLDAGGHGDEFKIRDLFSEFGMEEFEEVSEAESEPGDSASQVVANGSEESDQEDDEFAEFDFLPLNGCNPEQLPFELGGEEDAELWKFEFLK